MQTQTSKLLQQQQQQLSGASSASLLQQQQQQQQRQPLSRHGLGKMKLGMLNLSQLKHSQSKRLCLDRASSRMLRQEEHEHMEPDGELKFKKRERGPLFFLFTSVGGKCVKFEV
jgi:hypothetical protein